MAHTIQSIFNEWGGEMAVIDLGTLLEMNADEREAMNLEVGRVWDTQPCGMEVVSGSDQVNKVDELRALRQVDCPEIYQKIGGMETGRTVDTGGCLQRMCKPADNHCCTNRACSTGVTQIRPSPIWPVDAQAVMHSTIAATISSGATISSRTLAV